MRMLPGTVVRRPRMTDRLRSTVEAGFGRAKEFVQNNPYPVAGAAGLAAGIGISSLMSNDSPDAAQSQMVTPVAMPPQQSQPQQGQQSMPAANTQVATPPQPGQSAPNTGYMVGPLSQDDLRKQAERARLNASLNAFYALKLKEQSDLEQNGV